MNVALIFLAGHATKDAEVLKSKKDTEFAKFSLAVNEYIAKTKEEKVTYFDIIVFGKNAAKVAEHVKKGDSVVVNGRPEANAYLSKDGEAKASVTVIADSWQVLK